MSLQDHVPSLELCQEWKRLGGRQDTTFSWRSIETGKWFIDYLSFYTHPGIHIQQFAAPLASELMGWMKNRMGSVMHTISYDWKVYSHDVNFTSDKSLPNALMQMAIELKKKEEK